MAIVRNGAVVGAVAVATALAACSGNLGGGQSTLPGAPQPGASAGTNAIAVARPSPTPTTAANVITIGTTTAQPLPGVAGWGGSITFPPPAPPSAAPSAPASPVPSGSPTPVSISVAITSSLVPPADAPSFGGGKKGSPPQGLLFLRLLTTTDVGFAQYPTLAVDVPNAVAGQYAGRPFRLAVFDPSTKSKAFRVDVAQGIVEGAAATPSPGPTPTPSSAPGVPSATTLTPPPIAGPANLPAVHILFGTPAQPLALKANEGFVFAVYAATPTPKPSSSPKPVPSPTSSAAPAASASPAPSATPSATASPVPSPVRTISTQ